MAKATIRAVFGGFVKAIAENPELSRNVLLEGKLENGYQEEDREFSYSPRREIGTVFYRGLSKDGTHWFYFVPTPKLGELRKKDLTEVVKRIRGSGSVAEIFDVTSEKEIWDPPVEKKEKTERQAQEKEIWNLHVLLLQKAGLARK